MNTCFRFYAYFSMRGIFASTLFSLFFSILFFVVIFQLIGMVNYSKHTSASPVVSASKIEPEFQWSRFIECVNKRDWSNIDAIDCRAYANGLQNNKKGSNGTLKELNNEYLFIKVAKEKLGKQVLLNLIYLLLFLSLFVQSNLFFYTLLGNNLANKYFYLSDWAINSSPLLGVLGTVVSFADLVSNSGDADLQEIFKTQFSIATMMTITGGLIYIVNLFLAFFINQYIDEK